MSKFIPDPAFTQRAVIAIRHLESLITTIPRAEHRLDQLVTDIEAVSRRYVRGAHCFTCEASTKLPPIQHTTFCSDNCRRHDEDRESTTEIRIREALAEHIGPAEVPTL
jgi:RNase P subunit RPR2